MKNNLNYFLSLLDRNVQITMFTKKGKSFLQVLANPWLPNVFAIFSPDFYKYTFLGPFQFKVTFIVKSCDIYYKNI